MREIKLSKGMVALVDDQDYEKLKDYRWHTVRCNARNENREVYYARRREPIRDEQGNFQRYALIYMHRQIMGLPHSDRSLVVDHIDYNGLNNTRSNLRIVTFSENLRYKRPQQRKSGYKKRKLTSFG